MLYHVWFVVCIKIKKTPFTSCIAPQILVIAKLHGRKDFILGGFVCDIICPSKELPVQS